MRTTREIRLTAVVLAATFALAGCYSSDIERGVIGAGVGTAGAAIVGGSLVTGAAVGGAVGVVCDDINLC